PYAEGLAIIVMDRLCDIYVLLAFVSVGVAHFATVLSGRLAYVTWAGVGLTAIAPAILLVPGLAERVFGKLYVRLSKGREPTGFKRFLKALRAQLGPGLAVTLPLTVAAFMINYTQGWLIGHALGLDLAFFDVMCMLAITSLLGLLPVSISGVGVRELFLALVFPTLGLLPQQGVAFGLVVFVVIYLCMVVAGFFFWQIAPPPIFQDDGSGDGTPAEPTGGRTG
ncbi:MAG: flippase-like domain-containing protein, partial [Alphaproteobacteria bacterium]|nr:flippase-like domain-containing protein [Alphaproteobacteria bacterium]